jgi:hypothetical protein
LGFHIVSLRATREIWFGLRWSLGGGVASTRSEGVVAQRTDCFRTALAPPAKLISAVRTDRAALALARGGESLTVLDQTQREALAMLFVRLHSVGDTVNETIWGLWLVPFGMLVYRSGFLPRFLGTWLVVNGAAYVALSGIGLMRPELSGKAFLYAQPLLFGELAIMLWLIIKARSRSRCPRRPDATFRSATGQLLQSLRVPSSFHAIT